MEGLINTVNKLQDVFSKTGCDQIDLPQIVVVGSHCSQSCGKSSVLENIVCRDFLPRGTGIVTRRPLVLQLVQTQTAKLPKNANTDDSNSDEDRSSSSEPRDIEGDDPDLRAQFLHLPNRTFTDLNLVRAEIEKETERLAGYNKGISKSPIHLKIFSSKVLNLTLVDLPGLTKIPVGDQPSDIEKQTRDLIFEYISKPNSIILAISPANVDIVNSESLKIAREVDPEGNRTLGVITKIDIMDKGTNALDILTGRIYPLRLGFIGVINRSQEDTIANKPISESLKEEERFFESHSVYRTIKKHCGTANLARTLNQLLMAHIRKKLPDIKTKVSALISQTEQELASYGQDLSASSAHGSNTSRLLKLLTQYANNFTSSVEGTSAEITTVELCGGANLYYIFNHIYGSTLDSLQPTNNLTNKEIRTAIRNSTGPRASLFVPELAFQLLVKPQIKTLEAPSQRCVQLAYEELTKISLNCGSNELRRYPRLHSKILQVVSDLLRECVTPTSSYVESLIAIERAYINTNHPDFIGGTGALNDLQRKIERKHRESMKNRIRDPIGTIKHMNHQAHNEQNEYEDDIDNVDEGFSVKKREQRSHGMLNGETEHVQYTEAHQRQPSSARMVGGHNPALSQTIRSHSPNLSSGKFFQNFFGTTSTNRIGSFTNDIDADSYPAGRMPELPIPNKLSNPTTVHGTGFDGSSDYDNKVASLTTRLGEDLSVEERDDMETTLIRLLITSYFGIVRKTIQDLVPKAIMHLLVGEVCQSMQNRLVEELYKENLIDDLMAEDPSLKAEREQRKAMLEVYREAFVTLNEAA
ncbi:Dynamin- GTPase protein [Mycoemilia scoparia]|uniref:Dynamin- GTPase protein n=1 Tax=Mycoemilia scoparia TaxID=417184 RepID=A0A9W8A3E5_9FUNG|nr:Dynamin- GTPase protein [Mycoemilia scoparia]